MIWSAKLPNLTLEFWSDSFSPAPLPLGTGNGKHVTDILLEFCLCRWSSTSRRAGKRGQNLELSSLTSLSQAFRDPCVRSHFQNDSTSYPSIKSPVLKSNFLSTNEQMWNDSFSAVILQSADLGDKEKTYFQDFQQVYDPLGSRLMPTLYVIIYYLLDRQWRFWKYVPHPLSPSQWLCVVWTGYDLPIHLVNIYWAPTIS